MKRYYVETNDGNHSVYVPIDNPDIAVSFPVKSFREAVEMDYGYIDDMTAEQLKVEYPDHCFDFDLNSNEWESVIEIPNTVTRTWKVYGSQGHRQRESFFESYVYDFSEGDHIRIIEVENSDRTGTNEYSIVRITRNTAKECENELWGQVSDGIFENSRTGKVEEI